MLSKFKKLFKKKSSSINANYQPEVIKDVEMEDVDEKLESLQDGATIKAVIRHRSSKMNLPVANVIMINEGGELLLQDHSELNFNWEIISFEAIKKEK